MEQENKSLIALSLKLESLLIENDGEFSDEINQLINITENDIALKVDAYHYVIERMKAAQEYYKKQADDLTKIRKSCERLEETLKGRLKETMLFRQVNELNGQNRRFCLSDSRPRLVIDNENEIPAQYKVIKYEVDKTSLAVDLMHGKRVAGAHLEQSYTLRSYAVNPSRKKD